MPNPKVSKVVGESGAKNWSLQLKVKNLKVFFNLLLLRVTYVNNKFCLIFSELL